MGVEGDVADCVADADDDEGDLSADEQAEVGEAIIAAVTTCATP